MPRTELCHFERSQEISYCFRVVDMHRTIFVLLSVGLIGSTSLATQRSPNVGYIAPALSTNVPMIGLAAYKGDISTLRRCIAAGINLESSGRDGRAPLLLAAAGGHIDAVKILLNAGANVNARDHGRATALHWAALKGETKIALLLLSHHAEVNIQDQFGETPLIWAALAGDKTIVKELLRLGANPNLKDVDGWTASWCAKKNKYRDIVSLLENAR
jgi:ankyrin repeat protein